MKLIDILKLHNPLDYIRIYDATMYTDGHIAEDEEEHCVYVGTVDDCPWVYAIMEIFDPKAKCFDWTPIGTYIEDNCAYTDIWVAETPKLIITS